MKRRDANLILIVLAAIGGGIVAYVLPLSLFELALATSGLSERFPAFAPPLGETARLLLTVAGAIACATVVALALPWGVSGARAPGQRRERGLRFLFTRSATGAGTTRAQAPASLEHRVDTPPLADAPILRRSDSHPDAPARQPLFARRDLGEEALLSVDASFAPTLERDSPAAKAGPSATAPRPEPSQWREEEGQPEPEQEEQVDIAPPRAPEPLPWNLIEQEMSRILNGGRPGAESPVSGEEDAPAPSDILRADDDAEELLPPVPSASPPTIQQLVDRLERGIQRRKLTRKGEGRQDGESSGHHGPPDRAGPAGEDLQRALAALRATARAG